MRYVVSSFVIVLVSWFAHFFPRYYLSELALSFLPYWLVLLFCGLVFSLFLVRKYLQAKRRQTDFPWWWGFAWLFSLCFGVLFLLYSSQFTHFYTNTPVSSQHQTGNFTVLFANIHKNNDRYQDMEALIRKHNPDMLMFVEFSDHHYQALKEFLDDYYPYSNSTIWSKRFVGSMVFSKQKIENRADDFPQWSWRYGYFSLTLDGQEHYFYLVHTSSPDSLPHFAMRNEQLKTLDQDFTLHEKTRSQDRVVVVGDFNVTPRSAYYKDMEEGFSGRLFNMTTQFSLLFTRTLWQFPFLQAHIDHLRVSSGVHVDALESLSLPGSDHKGYLFEIGTE